MGLKYDVSTLSSIKFHEKQLLSETFFTKPSSSQDPICFTWSRKKERKDGKRRENGEKKIGKGRRWKKERGKKRRMGRNTVRHIDKHTDRKERKKER